MTTSRIRNARRPRGGAVLSLVVLALVAIVPIMPAQTVDTSGPRIRLGLFGNYVQTVHTADFTRLAGRTDIPYVSRFDGGGGQGIALGALFEVPLSETFWLGLHGPFLQSDNASLTTEERTTVIVADTTTFTGAFERRIEASVGTIGVEPAFIMRLPAGFSTRLGARVAFVTSSSFEQRDVLTEPADRGVFENGRRLRNEASGEIPGIAPMQMSAVLGLSRELAIDRNGTWFLAPEVTATYALTGLSDSVDWSSHSVRLGVGLKYAIPPAAPVVEPPPPPDPVPVEPPVLAADIRAVAVESDGTERPGVTIRVEEFISTQMRPMLNYVFFEEGSAALPSRYNRLSSADAASFELGRLHGIGALGTYYHMLNIVARRMLQNPRATITLTGSNAGTGIERGNTALSKQRAETVRDYLTGVWGIASDRVRVQARDLPQVASDTANPEAAAENRRVEIATSDPVILDAVFTEDTVRAVSPPMVRFYPAVRSEAGVSSWQLSARQGTTPVASFSGDGAVPAAIDWKPGESPAFVTVSTAPLTFALDVRDAAGQQTRTPAGQIPVEQVTLRRKREEGTADRRTDRYGLILFDYNRSDLNAANERIASMIRSRIPAGARVAITAFTDRIGEADYNLRLSQARAAATARALGVDATQARGVGEDETLFDNDLPEGRFYSRTVEVVVESEVR